MERSQLRRKAGNLKKTPLLTHAGAQQRQLLGLIWEMRSSPQEWDIPGILDRTFHGISEEKTETKCPIKICLRLREQFFQVEVTHVVFGSGDQEGVVFSPSLHPPAGWMQRTSKPYRMG